jgi:hypothetical protein
MYEYVGNLHIHTTYSDGAQLHDVIAASAIRAGLDFIVVTDHNVLVQGVEGYYRNADGRQILLLTGEEVHDMQREPQRNHLLVYGTGRELVPVAQNQPPQPLLDAVNATGGCAFLAHPIDRAVPWVRERSYSWVDWDIEGYTGIELWNAMSSLKTLLLRPRVGVPAIFDYYGQLPGPDPEIVALWDDLLRQGKRVAITGNSDAHGTPMGFGPIRKIIFPYEYLFRGVNTHVLLEQPLSGDWQADGPALYGAIARGHAFVGYGIPGDPRGFRFQAFRQAEGQAAEPVAMMGDDARLATLDLLWITAPAPTRLRLIRDGEVVAEGAGETLTFRPDRPGAYRAEAWRSYRGVERGWIFSNPIYVH